MVCNVVVVEYESIGAEGTGGRICVEGSLNTSGSTYGPCLMALVDEA